MRGPNFGGRTACSVTTTGDLVAYAVMDAGVVSCGAEVGRAAGHSRAHNAVIFAFGAFVREAGLFECAAGRVVQE
jgi:hypothetical protein